MTNIVDVIRARESEKEEEKMDRQEWEERKMADPNLVIPPSAGLPSLGDVMGVGEPANSRRHVRDDAGCADNRENCHYGEETSRASM